MTARRDRTTEYYSKKKHRFIAKTSLQTVLSMLTLIVNVSLKSREKFCAFLVDFEKVFDRLDRSLLMHQLQKLELLLFFFHFFTLTLGRSKLSSTKMTTCKTKSTKRLVFHKKKQTITTVNFSI